MKTWIHNHWEKIILLLIIIILFVTNYIPGTYLSGWDNLQTELSPFLAVKRAFFSVWEEYQSFGLLAGMAHAADLPRAIFLWIVSFLLPAPIVRYFFHFFMLFLGGLGMFKLLGICGLRQKKTPALVGVLFYLLNLGTIQMFFLPYEAFSVFFAFLPWELWIFLRILTQRGRISRKDLLRLFIINFLAVPQAYVQTIFLVYILFLGTVWLGLVVKNRSVEFIKRSAIVLFIIFAVNSFWILPQLYFFKTSGHVVKEAKINVLATENTLYQNKEKGDMASFIQLEGFYFDVNATDQNPLFGRWKQYFSNPLVQILPYLFFFISLMGIFGFQMFRLPFLLMWGLTATALISLTPPFSFINEFVRGNELINQVFRSPFTKFIIPHALITSVFFAFGTDTILNGIASHFKKSRVLYTGVVFLITALITLHALPSFQGYFLSPAMKVVIPADYFQLIDYFKGEDKNKRIALLPEYTFWGWYKNRWGYDGSGFLWYGIEQPIVSRTFDPWSSKSESYFWEMRTAINKGNVDEFEKVLEKYAIDYLVIDYSLMPVSSSAKGMRYEEIQKIIEKSKELEIVHIWENLTVIKVNQNRAAQNFVRIEQSLSNIGPNVRVTDEDVAYLANNDYQTDENKPYDLYYPFLDFTTQTYLPDKRWSIEKKTDSFFITSFLDGMDTKEYVLVNNSIHPEVTLFRDGELKTYPYTIHAQLNSEGIVIQVPDSLVYQFDPASSPIEHCYDKKGRVERLESENGLAVESQDGAIACIGFGAPELENRFGYLVEINADNVSGRKLFFYVVDNTKRQTHIEDRLRANTEYYLLNDGYEQGVGYSLSFQNDSHLHTASVNELKNLNIYLFPVGQIKNIALKNVVYEKNGPMVQKNFSAEKSHYYRYKIKLMDPSKDDVIILNQAFQSGWKAYGIDKKSWFGNLFPFIFGIKLNSHVLINNWANGWVLDADTSNNIAIIFLPQYLEFFGLLILVLTPLFIIKMPLAPFKLKNQSSNLKSVRQAQDLILSKVEVSKPQRKT